MLPVPPTISTCAVCPATVFSAYSFACSRSQYYGLGVREIIILIKVCEYHAGIVLFYHVAYKGYCFLNIGMVQVAEGFIHQQPLKWLQQRTYYSHTLLFAIRQ